MLNSLSFNFSETAVDARKVKILKWKKKKQIQNMLKKTSEKPVFKCGIVHHSVGSPYSKLHTFAPPNFKYFSGTVVRDKYLVL
jgi:hypothetical protein